MITKNKFLTAVSYVVLAGLWIWLVVSGAASLMKDGSASPNGAQRGDVCEFNVIWATEACTLKRTLNLIPTNKEYFYLVVADKDSVPFLVREKPSWFKNNFDEKGVAKGGAVKIKGAVTNYHSYKLTKVIDSINADISKSGLGVTVSTSLYIDALYKQLGGLRILAGTGILIVGALMFFGVKSGYLLNHKPAMIAACVAAVGVIGLTVYVLGMY